MASVRWRPTKSSREFARGSWTVSWYNSTGRRQTKAFREKVDALRFRKRVEKDPAFATPTKPFTVADACERYLRIQEQRRRDGEIGRQRLARLWTLVDRMIVPEIGRVVVEPDLKPTTIADWIARLRSNSKRNRSPEVVRETVDLLRGALTEAQRLELIRDNVLKRVPPRLPAYRSRDSTKVPSKAEVQALLNAADGRLHVLVSVACMTGLRFGEIAGLAWGNVDLEKRSIKVCQIVDSFGDIQSRTKTCAGTRDVPISQALSLRLKEWRLAHDRNRFDLLFISKKAKWSGRKCERGPMTNIPFQSEWKALLAKAGLLHFRFHALRHFAASLLIEQNLPPKHIQTIMGHASIQLTFDTYGHLFHDDQKARLAVDAIDQQFSIKEFRHG